jgi:hypothetical protein
MGAHAHNDQLGFELALGDQPLVVDPGSYLYTADPAARELFRSTGMHATLRIGQAEQQVTAPELPFQMQDVARAEALSWEPGDTRAAFEGRHHGFERLVPGATHMRRLELDGAGGTLTVRDTVSGEGSHTLEWSFPLAPCDAVAGTGSARAQLPGAELEISSPNLEFRIEPGWYSPSYGVREPAPLVRASRPARPGEDATAIVLRARAV